MQRPLACLLAIPLILAACGVEKDGASESSPLPDGAVAVTLSAQVPQRGSDRWLMWSPYGEQLPLTPGEEGLDTRLELGPQGTPPIRLRLLKSPDSPHFDRLLVDLDRDGAFGQGEALETTPTERNHKVWSSFDAVVQVPVVDPVSGEETADPYPISLWYVEDLRVEEQDSVLRFSRQGYLLGEVVLDSVEAVVLVTESVMDGVYGPGDAWALASRDSASDVLRPDYSRTFDQHAWLFDRAYRVEEIHPSGRRLVLVPFDPGVTRTAEEEMNDYLRVDREAPRSGRSVAFLHDFAEAETLARNERKLLLVDFETTWCGPCKVMDEWVYTADAVVDAAAALVSVKVDGDERLDLKERFGVSGFPTMVLLAPDGAELRRLSGYVNVEDMTGFLLGGS